jgi:hypothetical protein
LVRRLSILAGLLTLSVGIASGQDARTVLQASVKAMGGTDLKTIQYSGAGWFSQIGAQHVPTHGRIATNDEFMKMFAKADKANWFAGSPGSRTAQQSRGKHHDTA